MTESDSEAIQNAIDEIQLAIEAEGREGEDIDGKSWDSIGLSRYLCDELEHYARKVCERLLASGKYIPVDSVQSILDSLLHKDEFDDYTRAQNSAFRLVKYEIKKALFPKEKVEATGAEVRGEK